MHGRLMRRAGMVAGLTFGLTVLVGTVLPPVVRTPAVLAQEDDETPAEDEMPAGDELPVLDPTPTIVVPGPVASPPALVPSPGASPTPAVPVGDGIPEPPGVAASILSNGLKGDDVFRTGVCPTGWASGQVVGEGFRLRVTGPCGRNQDVASIAAPANGVTLVDGDVALDFKVIAGAGRATVNLYIRNRDGKLLATALNFQSDETSLFRREGTTNTVITTADGLRERAIPSDWNRLALRVRGGEVWVLLNDEPLLYAAEMLVQEGGMGIGTVREGNLDDEDEVAVVFRDLTVSAVDSAE